MVCFTVFYNNEPKTIREITPKFKATYFPDIEAACRETGWGKSAIGNNLFGITAGDKWTGKVQVKTTTEYFSDGRQGYRFAKVHSITPLADGRFRYSVDRAFRDYDSVRECVLDHFKVLSLKRYSPAMEYKQDVYQFAYWIAKCGYCTADPAAYAC